MIHPEKLGRYEYINYSINSEKYWSIKYLRENEYETQWGKVYSSSQGVLIIDEKTALKRIKEKISKGYCHVDTSLDEEHQKQWRIVAKEELEKSLTIKDEKTVPAKKIKI